MNEYDSTPLDHDVLVLRGRLQMTAALDALTEVGVTLPIEGHITKIIDTYDRFYPEGRGDDSDRGGLSLYSKDETIAVAKQVMIAGAEGIEQDDSKPFDVRVAASELLRILGVTKPEQNP